MKVNDKNMFEDLNNSMTSNFINQSSTFIVSDKENLEIITLYLEKLNNLVSLYNQLYNANDKDKDEYDSFNEKKNSTNNDNNEDGIFNLSHDISTAFTENTNTKLNYNHYNNKNNNNTHHNSNKSDLIFNPHITILEYLSNYIEIEDKILNLFGKINKENMNNEDLQKHEILIGKFNKLWGAHQNTWNQEMWELYNSIRQKYDEASISRSLNESIFHLTQNLDEMSDNNASFLKEIDNELEISKIKIRDLKSLNESDDQQKEEKFVCGKNCIIY